MQGIDMDSARALASAIVKLKETRESIQQTNDAIEGPLKERQQFLKHALVQLQKKRDQHGSHVNELLRVLQDLNNRNGALREQHKLSQEACLLVSVHGERMGEAASEQAAATEGIEDEILRLETAKEELTIKLSDAKDEVAIKVARLKSLRSKHAQHLLEKKRAENAADRVQLDNDAIRSILGAGN